jgi:hypothetical protein
MRFIKYGYPDPKLELQLLLGHVIDRGAESLEPGVRAYGVEHADIRNIAAPLPSALRGDDLGLAASLPYSTPRTLARRGAV